MIDATRTLDRARALPAAAAGLRWAGRVLCVAALALAVHAGDAGKRAEPDALRLAVGAELALVGDLPLAERLSALGTAALPALFATLAAHEAPRRDTPESEVQWVRLDARELEAVQAALLALPRQRLLDVLHGTYEDEGERWTAVRILGHAGSDAELPLLATLTDPGHPKARVPRSRRTAFQEALTGILARDALALGEVRFLFRRSPEAHLAHIVWAVGACPWPARLDTLGELLGANPEVDPLVLAELARAARQSQEPAAEGTLATTRGYLAASVPETVVFAIDAAEALEDVEALPQLIRLLEDPVRAVAKRAQAALRSLTGQDYGADARRWRAWHLKAGSWLNSTAPELLADIAGPNPAKASRALLEVSKWRVFRRELAPGVAASLARAETEQVVLACAVLGHFGSTRVLPELAALLSNRPPEVRRAALLALRRLTGRDLGSEPGPWLELARGSLQPRSPAAR